MENTVKVLVVDDNLFNRKITAHLLNGYGFETAEAEGGAQAVAMARETQYGLIFMDYMMPDLDGLETARIIREECGENGRTPAIIALTASDGEGEVELLLRNGFQDFMVKPLDIEPLERVLKKWAGDVFRAPEDGKSEKTAEELDMAKVQGETVLEEIRIPGIDIEELKKYHGGSAEDYLDLLELYLLDGRRKLPFLTELLEKEDYHTYEIEVHALKSASARLGAVRLSARAKEHEAAAGRGDREFIGRDREELFSEYEALLQEIDSFLGRARPGGDAPGQEEKACISGEELLEEVLAALEDVEDFRSRECAQRVEKLLGCQLEKDINERLEAVREQLKMYEDDEAERLLRDLKMRLEEGRK